MPSSPQFKWEWNITTILAVVNLLALVFFGGAAWNAVNAALAEGRQADERQVASLTEMRLVFDARASQIEGMATQREARIRALEVANGRTEAILASILETVNRSDENLQRLSDVVNDVIRNQP